METQNNCIFNCVKSHLLYENPYLKFSLIYVLLTEKKYRYLILMHSAL